MNKRFVLPGLLCDRLLPSASSDALGQRSVPDLADAGTPEILQRQLSTGCRVRIVEPARACRSSR
jgi:hypothetical protein